MGVASLKPPTAVSEFQVNRTAVPGFTSVSKINLESDKGSMGVATLSVAATDDSAPSDALIDELTATRSLLEDETLTASIEDAVDDTDETNDAMEEDAIDVSVVCAIVFSASTGTTAGSTGGKRHC